MKRIQSVEEIIKDWMREPFDPETREAVKALVQENKKDEIDEAFAKPLAFGTGGLRAKMGIGTGRMNVYTVQMVIQGYANWLKKTFDGAPIAVSVCHDCRLHSREFAEVAARVFAANDIVVYLTKDLRATPFLSYCIRYIHCKGGVNFTASHNPKEYNGCKIYDPEGCQVVGDAAKEIMASVEEIKGLSQVKITESLEHKKITVISEAVENAYMDQVLDLSTRKEENKKHGRDVKIIYSSMHGAGITVIPDTLKTAGFTDFYLTPKQCEVDGNFPTASYPNPEMDAALQLSWAELKKLQGDIVIASDPDSDRLSTSVRIKDQVIRLTGNEFAALLLAYLLETKKPSGSWATIMSIVSTPLVKKITESEGGKCFEVLTGFKYIGEMIHKWEKEKSPNKFLMGFEESLGYLVGSFVRDKDATIAALFAAEMTLYYKQQGKTLIDGLHDIYLKYGLYREGQKVLRFDDNPDAVATILPKLRKNPPNEIAGANVISQVDYLEDTGLPKSDVLTYYLDNDSRIILRPSGTEPTFKIYAATWSDTKNPTKDIPTMDAKLESLLDDIANDLK